MEAFLFVYLIWCNSICTDSTSWPLILKALQKENTPVTRKPQNNKHRGFVFVFSIIKQLLKNDRLKPFSLLGPPKIGIAPNFL